MKNLFRLAGIFALLVALAPAAASAQGKGKENAAPIAQGGELKGLDRADKAAGSHGSKGRAKARTRGANKKGFCPPGQKKKPGEGSRFKC